MKNSEAVIRSILGAADVDIRPLAYAVDAAVELMFRQGIPEDDIAVIKELYAKAAERLPKGKKGKRSVKTVTKQIQRVANTCWDTLVREGMVEHHLGRPRKTIPAPREMIFYLASQAYWEIPYFQAMEEGKFRFFSSGEPKTSQFQKKKRRTEGKDTSLFYFYNERTEESVTGNPQKFLQSFWEQSIKSAER